MKKIRLMLFTLLFTLLLTSPTFAKYVYDNADLLDEWEETALESKAEQIFSEHGYNAVIVTTNTLNGFPPKNYADNFYDVDFGGYGTNGVLFLVSMEDRDWYISTSGAGNYAIPDVDGIADYSVGHLSSGDYYTAFDIYLDMSENYISAYESGESYSPPKKLSTLFIYIVIALGIAIVIAFVWVSVLKSQLTSVKFQHGAAVYKKQGSFKVTDMSEHFVYRNVVRVPRPKSNGGSSSRSHGGGGKF